MKQKNALPTLAEVGERFKIARKAVGLKGVQLAALADVDQSSVSRFERGKRGFDPEPFLRVMGAAAQAGMSLDFVLSGEGSPKRVLMDQIVAQVTAAVRTNLEQAAADETAGIPARNAPSPKKKRRKTG